MFLSLLDQTHLLAKNRTAVNLLVWSIVAGAASGVSFIGLALLISEIVNLVFLERQSYQAITGLFAISLGLILIRACLLWVEEILAQQSANKIKSTLRSNVVQKLFRLGPSQLHEESSGEITHILGDGLESLNDYFTQYLPAKALAMLIPTLVFIVVLILDPWTTLVYVVAGPMLLLLLALIGGQTRAIQQKRFNEMRWMSSFFLDILKGLPTLKMFGRSGEQGQNIQEISMQFGKTTMEILRTAFQTSLVLEWSATAATAMVALEVSLRLVNGSLPFNIALAVLLLTPEFFLPLRQYALRYHAEAQAKSVDTRLSTILNTPESKSNNSSDNAVMVSAPFDPSDVKIQFSNVSFRYSEDRRQAVSDFALTIPNKSTVALVGPTGAGKSTIANLLLRFIEPNQGCIYFSDVNLESIPPEEWHKQIAWVPQKPHLFYGTITDNLLIARPNASLKEVIAASKAANAHDFILTLPLGYDTHLGEDAFRLSGGQRQRIAIARAFLKDAPILILDESTSHLDQENEKQIISSIQRLMAERTTLIIAHRLTLVKNSDQIVVLDNGRILQQGSHQDLLEQYGLYRRLYGGYSGEFRTGVSKA